MTKRAVITKRSRVAKKRSGLEAVLCTVDEIIDGTCTVIRGD